MRGPATLLRRRSPVPEELPVPAQDGASLAPRRRRVAPIALALGVLAVGAIAAATLVISVLERRSEIGLRRALGATRRHISTQFLTESLLLAVLGGVVGAALGAAATAAYALSQGWPAVVPPLALGGAIVAALAIGAAAGLYPAARAARLAPTEALRSI